MSLKFDKRTFLKIKLGLNIFFVVIFAITAQTTPHPWDIIYYILGIMAAYFALDNAYNLAKK